MRGIPHITIDKDMVAIKDEPVPIKIAWHTEEQRIGLENAVRYGNRAYRRGRITMNRDKDQGAVLLTRTERDRRNAKRRVAKKARKRNGGR